MHNTNKTIYDSWNQQDNKPQYKRQQATAIEYDLQRSIPSATTMKKKIKIYYLPLVIKMTKFCTTLYDSYNQINQNL